MIEKCSCLPILLPLQNILLLIHRGQLQYLKKLWGMGGLRVRFEASQLNDSSYLVINLSIKIWINKNKWKKFDDLVRSHRWSLWKRTKISYDGYGSDDRESGRYLERLLKEKSKLYRSSGGIYEHRSYNYGCGRDLTAYLIFVVTEWSSLSTSAWLRVMHLVIIIFREENQK